ncbi:mucin-1-like [Papaver somniferum]|uniref:mucin-1-like n=1 Tax=Papaver somniferum TaxID=3469 RepID=UPI000E70136A|nr:mucin-1-like [Papaver somniferum]
MKMSAVFAIFMIMGILSTSSRAQAPAATPKIAPVPVASLPTVALAPVPAVSSPTPSPSVAPVTSQTASPTSAPTPSTMSPSPDSNLTPAAAPVTPAAAPGPEADGILTDASSAHRFVAVGFAFVGIFVASVFLF